MSKYILLLNWTEQGIRSIKDSASRYDAAKASARSMGVTFEAVYMTFGQYDQLIIIDAGSDEAVATFVLRQGFCARQRAWGDAQGVRRTAVSPDHRQRLIAGAG
jgi:uncharacterized protein with GYD domain